MQATHSCSKMQSERRALPTSTSYLSHRIDLLGISTLTQILNCLPAQSLVPLAFHSLLLPGMPSKIMPSAKWYTTDYLHVIFFYSLQPFPTSPISILLNLDWMTLSEKMHSLSLNIVSLLMIPSHTRLSSIFIILAPSIQKLWMYLFLWSMESTRKLDYSFITASLSYQSCFRLSSTSWQMSRLRTNGSRSDLHQGHFLLQLEADSMHCLQQVW